MGCRPWCSCCGDKGPTTSGTWTREEDDLLISYMQGHKFICSWTHVPKSASLLCCRSCYRQWVHYLSTDMRHDKITKEEEELIIKSYRTAGNSWAEIARELPGRTNSDNRNYWKTVIKKELVSQNDNHFSHQTINKPTADIQTNSCAVKYSKLNLELTLNPSLPKPCLLLLLELGIANQTVLPQ